METEFVNIYIERIVKEVEELTKSRLLNDSKIIYLESTIKRQNDRIDDLEKQLEKINKKKTREVDTSTDTF